MFWKRPRFLIDDEEADWILDTVGWFASAVRDLDHLRHTPLILPTPEHFDPAIFKSQDIAQKLFDRVRALSGLQDWPCELAPGARRRVGEVSTFVHLTPNQNAPAGTFSIPATSNIPVITYDPSKVTDPISLTATFAHELAHYLMAGAQTEPPGGWDMHEPATDVLAVFMGFGYFLLESSFRFKQHQDFERQGWSYEKQGYLSPNQLIFTLAVFMRLTRTDISRIGKILNPHYGKPLEKTLDSLAKYYPDLDQRLS
jgi:hypothetical protein